MQKVCGYFLKFSQKWFYVNILEFYFVLPGGLVTLFPNTNQYIFGIGEFEYINAKEKKLAVDFNFAKLSFFWLSND